MTPTTQPTEPKFGGETRRAARRWLAKWRAKKADVILAMLEAQMGREQCWESQRIAEDAWSGLVRAIYGKDGLWERATEEEP